PATSGRAFILTQGTFIKDPSTNEMGFWRGERDHRNPARFLRVVSASLAQPGPDVTGAESARPDPQGRCRQGVGLWRPRSTTAPLLVPDTDPAAFEAVTEQVSVLPN